MLTHDNIANKPAGYQMLNVIQQVPGHGDLVLISDDKTDVQMTILLRLQR
jgi:hypothetical protein